MIDNVEDIIAFNKDLPCELFTEHLYIPESAQEHL